jgi:hypothetical protein
VPKKTKSNKTHKKVPSKTKKIHQKKGKKVIPQKKGKKAIHQKKSFEESFSKKENSKIK